jgi:hypothetical protein
MSIHNTKIVKLPDILLPVNLNMLDDRTLGTMFAPLDEFSDIFLGPFTDNFNPTITLVPHSAGEVKPVRRTLGAVTVRHTLDTTRNQYFRPSHH